MLSHSAACGFILRAEEATSTEDGIREVGTHGETKPLFRTKENHFQKIPEHLGPPKCGPGARKPVLASSTDKETG